MMSMRRRRIGAPRRSNDGFTLLEAIVALVIFSTAGLAMFSWINQNLQALARVSDVSAEARAKRNILEFMTDINPMERVTGANDFGAYRIEWRNAEQIAPTANAGYPKGTGAFLVGLYLCTIDVSRPGGNRWFSFDLKLVGYRRLYAPAQQSGPNG